MIIIPATREDIPTLFEMAHEIWNKHYVPVIGKAQVDYMLSKIYDEGSLKKQMDEGQEFFLFKLENVYIGFMGVTKNEDGSLFLNKLYISESGRGKGMGKKAIQFILEKYNHPVIKLQVNRQNYTAVNFYFATGFVISRVADFDIGNGFMMNDFIMVRN